MSDFPINPNPEFQETMRQLQPNDPAHADMFNQMFQTLLDNDAFLNVLAERMIEKNAIANNLTTNDTNMVLSAAMGKTLADQVKDTITSDTKDNITTFLQSGTRSNITSGENHSFMLGKISRWFADLKEMAFKDKVAAGDLEASLKSYIDSKFAAENIVQNAEIADEAKVASSAVTHDLQQQITEQNNNLHYIAPTRWVPEIITDSGHFISNNSEMYITASGGIAYVFGRIFITEIPEGTNGVIKIKGFGHTASFESIVCVLQSQNMLGHPEDLYYYVGINTDYIFLHRVFLKSGEKSDIGMTNIFANELQAGTMLGISGCFPIYS